MKVATPAILVGKHVAVSGRYRGSGRWDGNSKERSHLRMAHLAPIETGMGNYEFDSRDEQGSKGNDCDPMRDTDQCSVTRPLARKRIGRRHARKHSTGHRFGAFIPTAFY